MSPVFVMDHRLFWNTKILKMPTKSSADAMYDAMSLNENDQ